MRCHVQFHEGVGTVVGKAFGLLERAAELSVQRPGRLQRQRFGQVPEQLVQLPYDPEDLEHLLGGARCLPPVQSAETASRDPLPGAEAVVHRATRKAPLP